MAAVDLNAVFRAEFGYVWNTLLRFGVRRSDLEDLTHDVFVAFHRSADRFDPERPIRPWLAGIAFRVASDHRRLARHRREVGGETGVDPADAQPLADEQLSSKEDRDLLLSALQHVEEERRAVLVMADIDGLAMPAITRELGIPLNTGYSRLRLARKELAEAVRALRGKEVVT